MWLSAQLIVRYTAFQFYCKQCIISESLEALEMSLVECERDYRQRAVEL
jgi:hypothetical protein